MVHYIETQTKDGQTIRIEVDDIGKSGAGFTRQTSSTNVSGDTAKDTYDQTLGMVRGLANGLIETLQAMDSQPNSASVDFAIKVDAETGPLVAKSRDAGQFRISLSWKQPEPDKENEKET